MKQLRELAAFVAVAAACSAQAAARATVWIDPANPSTPYIEAAAMKKAVPVSFTDSRHGADLLAVVSSDSADGDRVSMSLTVADASDGAVVFAYTCRKLPTRGLQAAAECIAKHWRAALAKASRERR